MEVNLPEEAVPLYVVLSDSEDSEDETEEEIPYAIPAKTVNKIIKFVTPALLNAFPKQRQ